MPVQRLEARRDSRHNPRNGRVTRIQHCSDPSVRPYISAYQEGRGKPKTGPLDGDGRRSIYIQVRRNFMTPLFLAFDYPTPISAIGIAHRIDGPLSGADDDE